MRCLPVACRSPSCFRRTNGIEAEPGKNAGLNGGTPGPDSKHFAFNSAQQPPIKIGFVCSLSSTGSSSRIALRQYHELGFKIPVIGDTSTFDEDVVREAKEVVPIGSVSASTYSAVIDTAANKAFIKAYRDRYGVLPTHFSEAGYTTGLWIKKGLESVGGSTDDKEKLLAALKTVSLPDAPRGPVKLDEYGNPVENVYIRKVQKVGDDLQNTVILKIPNVSQFWKYKPADILSQPRFSRDYPPCKFCSD
jgi:branched-chain amino acid transport system substrate-binding protein